MLKREEIEAALADTFILSLYNEYFNRTAMYVQQIIQPWSFNYGIGLSGNVTKLGRVFTDFIHSNQQMLTNTFVQYIRVVEKVISYSLFPSGFPQIFVIFCCFLMAEFCFRSASMAWQLNAVLFLIRKQWRSTFLQGYHIEPRHCNVCLPVIILH